MLHQALRDYRKWIKGEYYRPELGRLMQWGHTHLGQVDRLIHHHPDRRLSTLDEDGVDGLIGYWRRRPLTKTKKAETPVTPKSASNYMAELRRFFRWLHRSPKYDWQRPPGRDRRTIARWQVFQREQVPQTPFWKTARVAKACTQADDQAEGKGQTGRPPEASSDERGAGWPGPRPEGMVRENLEIRPSC